MGCCSILMHHAASTPMSHGLMRLHALCAGCRSLPCVQAKACCGAHIACQSLWSAFWPMFICAGSSCALMSGISSMYTSKRMFTCTVQDTSDQDRAAMYKEDAEHHDINFFQVRYRMLISWHVIGAQGSRNGSCLLLHIPSCTWQLGCKGGLCGLCHVTDYQTSTRIPAGGVRWTCCHCPKGGQSCAESV